MGFVATLPIAERFFRNKHIYRSNSHFAAEQSQELVARLARGEAAYLAGISIGGFDNTGAALVVTAAGGLRIICMSMRRKPLLRRFAPPVGRWFRRSHAI
jgi:carbamoyltransferase